MKKQLGLLVLAYGTPYKEEDVERYYTHIRRGRKPSPEMVEELKARYRMIGGISPLATITRKQAEALERYLNKIQDKFDFKLYLGLKHIEPFIEDAVKEMHWDGIKEAVSIILAPHSSKFNMKTYYGRALETAKELGGPDIITVESWYKEPKFIQYWSEKVRETLAEMPPEQREKAVLIFSAHSLPEKMLQGNDPYPHELQETAKLIAEASGFHQYAVGWQSAGNTPDPWLGPDVQDLTRELYDKYKYQAFIYLPVGFVSEHLEVLYDNDIECKAVTDELGVKYFRPAMPNDHPLLIEAMAEVIMKKLV